MLCAEATSTLRRKYALSASSCRSPENCFFVVERLMLITSKPWPIAQRRPSNRTDPLPLNPAPSTRTLNSRQSGASECTIPADAAAGRLQAGSVSPVYRSGFSSGCATDRSYGVDRRRVWRNRVCVTRARCSPRGSVLSRANSFGHLNPSAQRCVEGSRRRFEVEGLSRSCVEFGGDRVELRLAEFREVGAFRQVLAEEPVG